MLFIADRVEIHQFPNTRHGGKSWKNPHIKASIPWKKKIKSGWGFGGQGSKCHGSDSLMSGRLWYYDKTLVLLFMLGYCVLMKCADGAVVGLTVPA